MTKEEFIKWYFTSSVYYPTPDIMYDKLKEVFVSELQDGLKPKHKCEFIARAFMGENRDWWLGKLTEQVPEWPAETHCLHLKTPVKDVVFLCNSGDFQQLAVLIRHALGYEINENWMQSSLKMTADNKNISGLKTKSNEINSHLSGLKTKEGK